MVRSGGQIRDCFNAILTEWNLLATANDFLAGHDDQSQSLTVAILTVTHNVAGIGKAPNGGIA